MLHTFKGSIFTLSLVITVSRTDAGQTVRANLPDLSYISQLFQQFVKPYIKTLSSSRLRSDEALTVERAINERVSQLKPYLQDNDNASTHKKSDEDENDTTIIEFLPNIRRSDHPIEREELKMKSNIEKYKRMRNKIKRSLIRESVQNKTRYMVTRTLDEMILQLVSSKCEWSGSKDKKQSLRDGQAPQPLRIAQSWSTQWGKLKDHYLRMVDQPEIQVGSYTKDVKAFLQKFDEFFAFVMKDANAFSQSYKVRCQVVERDKPLKKLKQHIRSTDLKKKGNSDDCTDFKVCSEELKKFMTDFYDALNETAISTIKNYAAMYIRDVTENVNETDVVGRLIYNVSEIIGRKVSKTFSKETTRFELDKNKERNANINALTTFIKSTIESTKTQIRKRLDIDLSPMRSKLRDVVIKDIIVNLESDTKALEEATNNKLCSAFQSCNGIQYRRSGTISSREKKKENKIFVKLQLSLDDEKDDEYRRNNVETNSTIVDSIKGDSKQSSFVRKFTYANVTITRTTPGTAK